MKVDITIQITKKKDITINNSKQDKLWYQRLRHLNYDNLCYFLQNTKVKVLTLEIIINKIKILFYILQKNKKEIKEEKRIKFGIEKKLIEASINKII